MGVVGVNGLLRVRNEARWIERSIRSILPICSKVIVLDDHSEDETREICAGIPDVQVFASPFTGLNETRDKNHLLGKVPNNEWVLMIDGDEMLAPGAAEVIESQIAGKARCLAPRILYLWDSEDQIRVDGIYGRFRRPSVFLPGMHLFEATSAGGNFHCGNAPRALQVVSVDVDASFLHFGYMHKEDRVRKFHWYNQADPKNRVEDQYRHVCQGDIPEVPASSKLMHAGPLKLEALCSRAA